MIFDSSIPFEFRHGNSLALSSERVKQQESNTSLDFHPCQYDGDLGSDSDRYSQTSSEDVSSQDSNQTSSSPAISCSSDEDQPGWRRDDCSITPTSNVSPTKHKDTAQPRPESQKTNCLLRDALHCASRGIRKDVPFRPKPHPHPQSATNIRCPKQASTGQNFDSSLPRPQSNGPPGQNRRRGRSIGAAASVPHLRRDTDHTDAIVRMIVLFCTNLINSIWCSTSTTGTDTTTSQSTSNVLPLQIFITETLRRSKTSYSTLQIALYYLILLKQCLPPLVSASQSAQPDCRAMQCGRRMFLTSLILASKYLQDRNYSARAWSKISGLPLKEINDNERRFLSIVCWDLHVPKQTFENWSKIVLNVCRRSMDPDVGCKTGLDRQSPRSSPKPDEQSQTGLQTGCANIDALRSWWLVSLQKLRTDIVKCGVKTERYVESIAPFRGTPFLPRPVPETGFEEHLADAFMGSDVKGPSDKSRASSQDRTRLQFEPVPDLLHPAAPLAVPPPPTLRNLPTPQTTPQGNLFGWPTPKLPQHPSAGSSLRCRASASVLGNAFRRHCPIANLETCPPPKPRAYIPPQRPGNVAPVAPPCASSIASLTSSPESVVSDISSFTSRSRSSSISSTSSRMTASGNISEPSWWKDQITPSASEQLTGPQECVQGMKTSGGARIGLLTRFPAPAVENQLERPRTAFKVPNSAVPSSDVIHPQVKRAATSDTAGNKVIVNDGHRHNMNAEKEHGSIALPFLHVDDTAVRARARPTLSRCQTQIFNPRQKPDSKSQHLKRCRSESLDSTNTLSSMCEMVQPASTAGVPNLEATTSVTSSTKDVQHPSQIWATSRMPLQFGTQNKRLALQVPVDLEVSDLAPHYLRSEMCANRLGPICH